MNINFLRLERVGKFLGLRILRLEGAGKFLVLRILRLKGAVKFLGLWILRCFRFLVDFRYLPFGIIF